MSEAGHNNLLQIAQVLKSNGTDGGLMIGLHDITTEDINSEEPVFIYFDGLPVPFFVESIEPKGSRALVHLTGIHNFADAEEVVGQGIFVQDDDQEDDEDSPADLSDLVGWTIKNDEDVNIGEITDFEDIPGNPCLYVDTKNGQKLIPLNEDLILSVDSDARIICMQIPDGLL
jgi:16S rRNA processing protein RimM